MAGFRLDWQSDGLLKRVRKAERAGINATMAACVARAQQKARRDTGLTADTIEIIDPATHKGTRTVGSWGSDAADNTLWNEIGTQLMPAQPVLRPAADAEYPGLAARIKEAM